ncbi:DUF1707 SHOCT-like domain-containing protein [Actinocatenispora thailandica]|nr:DUF1707 domain-containing protein [Actinocatenispora thailandica]
MMLGWSDGGYGELRATADDRRAVRRLLHTAEAEGRLDAAEYDRRLRAVDDAGTRARLAALTSDLPTRRGERDWDNRARIRSDDRELAVRILAEAAAHERLSSAEYEQRVATLPAVVRYSQLKRLLDGLPGWPDAPDDLLADTADRDAARTALHEAVRDHRLDPVEVPVLDAEIGQARRRSDLARLVASLDDRVGDRRRDEAARDLDAAYQAGQLDAHEQAERAAKLRHAVSGPQLTALLRDLTGADRRPADSDRAATIRALGTALDRGRLTLPEYEDRLAAAAAAITTSALRDLLADLADPPKRRRRGPLDVVFDHTVGNSALLQQSDRWWRRPFPKPAWKLAVGAALIALAGLTVRFPIAIVGWVVGGGFALLIYIWALALLVGRRAGTTIDRRAEWLRRRVQDELRALPGVSGASISYGGSNWREKPDSSVLTVRLELDSPDQPPRQELIDAVARVLWLSRIYPLGSVGLILGSADDRHTIEMNRAGRRRLRETYGPRPYGPLPSWHTDSTD